MFNKKFAKRNAENTHHMVSNLNMWKINGYGSYMVTATINGESVKMSTNNSVWYDNLYSEDIFRYREVSEEIENAILNYHFGYIPA